MSALTPQAILDRRSTDRASVPMILGLVAGGICSLLALGFYLWTGGPLGVAVGTLLALPTALVLIGMILLIDRLEPEPRANLWLALAWGAGVALLGALIVNTMTGLLLYPAFGAVAERLLVPVLVAPFVEEGFKGSLLLLLLWRRRDEIDGPTDGIVYAGLCGLGFALVENIMYYMRGLAGPEGQFWVMVLLRGVISPLGHPLYTSMIGLGVAYAATRRGPGGIVAVIGGWCAAVALHSMWNFSAMLGLAGLVPAYLVLAGVLAALIVIIVRDRKRIVRLISTYLPAYVPSGLVQPHDVRMLGDMAARKRARTWARAQAGATGARAMGDYQLAATELALLHAQAARATVSPPHFHSRRQAILQLMRFAQSAFFRRVPQAAPPPWSGGEQTGFVAAPVQLQDARLPRFRPQVPIGPAGPLQQPQPPAGYPVAPPAPQPPHAGPPRPPPVPQPAQAPPQQAPPQQAPPQQARNPMPPGGWPAAPPQPPRAAGHPGQHPGQPPQAPRG